MARKKRIAELEAMLEKIPEDLQYMGRDYVDKLIYLKDETKRLERDIKANGTEEKFVNGKQKFIRPRAAFVNYNTLLTQFDRYYTKLKDLLPKTKEPERGNALKDFLEGKA